MHVGERVAKKKSQLPNLCRGWMVKIAVRRAHLRGYTFPNLFLCGKERKKVFLQYILQTSSTCSESIGDLPSDYMIYSSGACRLVLDNQRSGEL